MNVKNILKNVDYKGLALQHCEKAVIVVVTALLVMFLFYGAKKAMSASDITPDQIALLADKLTDSINKSTWEGSPDRDQVKNPDFEKQIKELMTGIDSDQFKLSAPYYFNFVDFGGILRQKPDILKPYNPLVFADKGAVSMYKVDKDGKIMEEERIVRAALKKKAPDEEESSKKKKTSTAKTPKKEATGRGMAGMMGSRGRGGDSDSTSMADSLRSGMMGGRGSMMGSGGGMMGSRGMSMGGGGDDDDAGGMESMLSGNIGAATQGRRTGGSIRRNLAKSEDDEHYADDPQPGKAGAAPGLPGAKPDPKAPQTQKVQLEDIRGVRWAVITALYPHIEQLQEYEKKLHTPDDPPAYKRVTVERREVTSDGSLSDWASIDLKKEAEFVRLMPDKKREVERAELVAANAVFAGLMMPLPELVTGRWAYHNQRGAVEAAAKSSSAAQFAGGRGGRGMAGDDGGLADEDNNQERLSQEIFGGESRGRMSVGRSVGSIGATGGSGGMQESGMRGSMAMSSQGGGMGGGMERFGREGSSAGIGQQAARSGLAPGGNLAAQSNARVQPTQRTNAEVVQIRFIDYTVDPEHTYQYRLKVVVENPNHNRQDVLSEDLAKDETLTSEDWSEPTNPVYVPADTEYFVLERVRTREEAKLQVHKWLADLGDWQFSDFYIKPGDPIGGEVRDYPLVDWKDKVKKKPFDFSTQDLLLDVTGGSKSFTFVVDGKDITYNEPLPAEIFVVDRLGDLATRNEDFDKNNSDRKERESEIARLRKEAKEKEDLAKKGKSEGDREGFDERVPTRKGGDANKASKD